MGYYIEVPENHGKASQICKLHDGKIVSFTEAQQALDDSSLGVIVVLDNGMFEAAGFCFSKQEFKEFTADDRNKQYVLLERSLAEKLSGFSRD